MKQEENMKKEYIYQYQIFEFFKTKSAKFSIF